MRTLSKHQIILLHEHMIQETGGGHGLRDEGMLDSAMAAPFQEVFGTVAYPSILQKAVQLGKPVVVLAGRPYHIDPEICHGIDDLICSLGAAVITEDAVSRQVETQRLSKGYFFEISTELDNAEARIREATLRTLADKYPDYADSVQVYKLSEYLPVYAVRMTKTVKPAEE